ncbi:trypsin-like peptidase domain-containing protein [Paenibacillus sp. TRM 82003]|uniref:S1C family serine protease n=1 Tax=Kineococcus sp. TRM81007 TaxID=2925831 RepID=UPI001F5A4B7F|nr:trypsin-like peptidase domain-containing protein [Kineococcus sp. TRM81007]MCI2239182.1 trypsin-like peptidase domain-containing protein [Kineococcus sp. TRM81007]MCI3924861.1 trypsin-like peptidase domain-containing protein [Paenibacillus sp. TRM 82003]
MSGPSAPGGWGHPSGETPREAPHDAPGAQRDAAHDAQHDPWAAPPPAPSPHSSAWGAPPGEPAWPAAWPAAAQAEHAWPPPAAPPRGRAARLLGAGSAVLLLSVAGGIAGSLLQERWDDSRTYPSVTLPVPAAGTTERPEGSVAAIAAAALPSVVALQVEGSAGAGTGSGFVLDAGVDDGEAAFVLTNDHVVAGAADDGVTVVFQDGVQVPGEIVGSDTSYDLAVVRVERPDLRALPMGDSGSVVVGDRVVAVGAPLGLQGTVTEGIVSALNRPVSAGADGAEASYIQAIQTDAAINPGNSGGPLLNTRGEVVGVNSAIASVPVVGGSAGSIGLGFSIPAEQARRTAEQLIRTGRAVHPVIRVSLDGQYRGEGVLVLDQPGAVQAGGPGDRAGLRPGDVVLGVDGRPVTEPAELIVDIRARQPGDTVTLTVRRGEQTLEVPVTLEADG